MTRRRKDFQSGTLTSGISNSATTITSAGFASLPAIVAPDTLAITVDPAASAGAPEIVTVTAHTALSTSVTVTRGAEGSTARSHLAAVAWVHAPTVLDFGTTEKPIYYVNKGASASDSNDGLSPQTAFATIAGAITGIGGSADNTNVARLKIGYGTYGSSGSPVATQTIKGVIGLIVEGLGEGLTQIWGPDAAALFKLVNCTDATVQDFTYMGSAAATGWCVEQQSNWTGSAFVGGVASFRNKYKRITTGTDYNGAVPSAANFIRFSLAGGATIHDANNDQNLIEDCKFYGVTGAPISIEHQNCLFNKVVRPIFGGCGGGVRLTGGSVSLISPTVIGGTGWFIDIQNPVGASNPIYTQKAVEVFDIKAEAGAQGWVRSSAGAGVSYAGRFSLPNCTFYGGQMAHGGEGGANGKVIDWNAATSLDSGPSRLEFIGGRYGAWYSGLKCSAPSTTSVVSFVNCDLAIAVYEWAGELHFTNCQSEPGVQETFTPTGTAFKRERSTRGLGGFAADFERTNTIGVETTFVSRPTPGVIVSTSAAPLFALNGAWQDIDLTTLVPVGVKSILIQVYTQDTTAGEAATVRFRQKGGPGNTGARGDDTEVEVACRGAAGALAVGHGKVTLSTGRFLQYKPAGYSALNGLIAVDMVGYWRV